MQFKKNSDLFLWLLLAIIIIAIAFQWGTKNTDVDINTDLQVVISSGVERAVIDDAHNPFLTLKLSSPALTIDHQRLYTINIDATSNTKQSISWRHQPIDGIGVSIKKNQLVVTVDDIKFRQATLQLIFSTDNLIVKKSLLLINTRKNQEIQPDDALTIHNQESIIEGQLNGIITFDRLSFIESTLDNSISYHFNPDAPLQQPVRFMLVYLRDANNSIIDRTYTDINGHYQFNVSTDSYSPDYFIEVVSQMMIVDSFGIHSFSRVINQGSAYQNRTTFRRLYHATSPIFRILSGENQQDLHIKTGWHATLREFEPSYSAAQPFAILDTLAKGYLYLQEHQINITKQQKMLTVHWSQDPDIIEDATGYYNSHKNIIYISGNNALDTQQKPLSTISEWNEHTILHEFGHFYLSKIVGRDDSRAGKHTAFGFGSLTLALSEGVANSLAKAILKDWQNKRVHIDVDQEIAMSNAKAIARDDTTELQRNLLNQHGEIYQRPQFDFSPFIEETISYFILSIIDPRSEYSARTTKLSDDIGMAGLHQALRASAQRSALMTIYSLAQQLKERHPRQQFLIDELGQQLELTFNDEWGTSQPALSAHIIGLNNTLLPEKVQYPFYKSVDTGQQNELAFNGALQSLSAKRPGTLRYFTFLAPKDGRVIFSIKDIIDDDSNRHIFSFNIVKLGDVIAWSNYSDNHHLNSLSVSVKQDQQYIIRVFDEFYNEEQLNSDETVTTQLEIDYR